MGLDLREFFPTWMKQCLTLAFLSIVFLKACIATPTDVETTGRITPATTATNLIIEHPEIPGLMLSEEISFPYGVVYPYKRENWSEKDLWIIRKQLENVKSLGVNTVIQTFDSQVVDGRENWLIYLDEADRVGIQVVAQLYPISGQDGVEYDFLLIRDFLEIVKDHPALIAYLGFHEPLENYTTDQLRKFYVQFKSIAPQTPLAHYMGDMHWFDQNSRYPGREFSSGICDICIIWYYPAISNQNQPLFMAKQLRNSIKQNRQLVDQRAPNSQLWFLGQAFTYEDPDTPLRMPTPQEMELIFSIAEQEKVDGFLWYPWLHNLYQQVLSDKDLESQRQAVYSIYMENFGEHQFP